jgi:hypothetical protein
MSKGYKDSNLNKLSNALRSEVKEVEFVNSRGLKLKLHALSPYLVQMATESVEKPSVPTYTITTADGSEETHFHDEESIAQSSDEEKKKWETYKKGIQEAEAKASEILLNIILIEGVELPIQDEDKWVKRQKLMGITVPDDEEERSLMYKKQNVIGNTQDIELVTRKVMELTGVSREEVDLVKKSFQNPVEPES